MSDSEEDDGRKPDAGTDAASNNVGMAAPSDPQPPEGVVPEERAPVLDPPVAQDSNGDRELGLDEVGRRLELSSKEVIEELHTNALRNLESEDARGARLDAKATALFTANGLAVTVAFTFGASTFLGHSEYFEPIKVLGYRILSALFFVSLLCGLASGYYALRALRVRFHKAVDDRDVFNETVLAAADACPEGDDALALYRRYMTAHIWAVAKENGKIYDKKADEIEVGQTLFFWFLVAILLIGAAIAVTAFVGGLKPTGGEGQQKSSVAPAATSADRPVLLQSTGNGDQQKPPGVPAVTSADRPILPEQAQVLPSATQPSQPLAPGASVAVPQSTSVRAAPLPPPVNKGSPKPK